MCVPFVIETYGGMGKCFITAGYKYYYWVQILTCHTCTHTHTMHTVHNCQEQHCIFIPFVIETYGGLGKKAQDFLNELSIFAIDHALIKSRFDIVNGLRYAIACSVQRG